MFRYLKFPTFRLLNPGLAKSDKLNFIPVRAKNTGYTTRRNIFLVYFIPSRVHLLTLHNLEYRMMHFIDFIVLSSLFEKLRDARDKTLVCKNRKPKKIA
jgi:hypothetical protein